VSNDDDMTGPGCPCGAASHAGDTPKPPIPDDVAEARRLQEVLLGAVIDSAQAIPTALPIARTIASINALVSLVERVVGERDAARMLARREHPEDCDTMDSAYMSEVNARTRAEVERDAAIRERDGWESRYRENEKERDAHVCLDPAHPDCIVLLKSAADFLVGTMRNAEGLLAECQAAREKGEFIGMGCGKCAPVGEPSVFNIHAPSGCKAESRP